jgi:predicted P-loop ATPase
VPTTTNNNQQSKKQKNNGAAKQQAPRPVPTIQKVENFLSKLYDFRYNEVSGKIEGKSKNQADYQPVSDYIINSLSRQMMKADIPCSANGLRNILLSDYVPVYNPFKHYFHNLPAWDGTDYIQQLAETVKTTDDPLWQMCFRKWIVALVAGLLIDKVVNHTVIVFSGKQGVGKTTWILNLVPPQLKEYSFSGTINPGNKDTLIQLSECMLINLDELENLNRTELGTMKEIITKASIRIRRPYGYSTETLPRRATFAGSVNNKEFLSDTTGSRRFLCFEVTAIDYQHTIPLDGVYAQAKHLLDDGFKYWFDQAEIEAINKNNEQYRSMSVEEELLLTWFEPCNPEEGDLYLSTTELAAWFTEKVKMNVTDATKQKLGKALRAHKFQRIKRQDRYVYALKQKDEELVCYQTRFKQQTDLFELEG